MAREFMGEEPLHTLIPRLAAPTVAVSLVSLLYTVVDRMFIGHIPSVSTQCLAGLGICFPVIALVSAFAALAGNGAAPLASIALGAQDAPRAQRFLGCAAWLLTVFTACIMLAGYACLDPLLLLFGCDDSTLPYAHDYLAIYLAGTPFVLASVGFSPFLAAQGDSRFALASAGVGLGVNIALDALFIWLFGWGMQGAAAASVIAQLLSAVVVCAVLARPRAAIRLGRGALGRPSFADIAAVLRLGAAPFFVQSTESLLVIILNMLLAASGGTAYIACLTIMTSIVQLVFSPCSGYAQGAQPVMSYSWGAGLIERVRKCIRAICLVPWAFAFVVTLLVMAFPAQVAGLFTEDAQVLALASQLAPVYMAGMLVFGLQLGMQQVFMGLDMGICSLAVATVRKFAVFIPLACALTWKLGPFGVFLAEPVSDVISVVFCVVLFAVKVPAALRRRQDS